MKWVSDVTTLHLVIPFGVPCSLLLQDLCTYSFLCLEQSSSPLPLNPCTFLRSHLKINFSGKFSLTSLGRSISPFMLSLYHFIYFMNTYHISLKQRPCWWPEVSYFRLSLGKTMWGQLNYDTRLHMIQSF